MRIAVCANLKGNAPVWEGMPPEQWDDLDNPKTVKYLAEALESLGHKADFFEGRIGKPYDLPGKLSAYKPDLCFNIAEGHVGDSRESHVPAVLEMLRIPYTASRVLALAATLDKPLTKRILHYHGLPTPEFQVFDHPDEEIYDDLAEGGSLRFPLFLKPSREGTGVGVSAKSIVNTVPELREVLAEMLARYKQPILCERYIKGRELTVGFIGNLKPFAARRLNDRTAPAVLPPELTFFPAMEVNLEEYGESEAGLYTNKAKTDLAEDFHFTCPANISAELLDELNRLAAAVFRVMGCSDVSRVDFRLDGADHDKPYILEINALPGLNKDYSDLPLEAYAKGWTFEQLIDGIVWTAAERWGIR